MPKKKRLLLVVSSVLGLVVFLWMGLPGWYFSLKYLPIKSSETYKWIYEWQNQPIFTFLYRTLWVKPVGFICPSCVWELMGPSTRSVTEITQVRSSKIRVFYGCGRLTQGLEEVIEKNLSDAYLGRGDRGVSITLSTGKGTEVPIIVINGAEVGVDTKTFKLSRVTSLNSVLVVPQGVDPDTKAAKYVDYILGNEIPKADRDWMALQLREGRPFLAAYEKDADRRENSLV